MPALDQRAAGVVEGVEEVGGRVVLGPGQVDRAVRRDHGGVLQGEAGHHRAFVHPGAGGQVEADDDVAPRGGVGHVDRVAVQRRAAARGDRAGAGAAPGGRAVARADAGDGSEVAHHKVAVRRQHHAVVAAGVDLGLGDPDHRPVVGVECVHRGLHRGPVARPGGVDQAAGGARDPGRPVAGLVGDVLRPQLAPGGEVHGHHRRALGGAAELSLADHEHAVAVDDRLPGDEGGAAPRPEGALGGRRQLAGTAVAPRGAAGVAPVAVALGVGARRDAVRLGDGGGTSLADGLGDGDRRGPGRWHERVVDAGLGQ